MSHTTPDFSKLGRVQKYIIKKMVEDDYYLLRTFDVRDMTVTVTLLDDEGEEARNLTEKELQALVKRGILCQETAPGSLEVENEKFYINEAFATEAMNACC